MIPISTAPRRAQSGHALRVRHRAACNRQLCWAHPTNHPLTTLSGRTICECMIDEDFQLTVEAFIRRHDLSPTTFGLWAMNDSRFVFDLRDGRVCFGKTIRRVYQFMDDYERKQEAKRMRLATQNSRADNAGNDALG